jgi:glycosyltransferase involved in cell wall biosynthesis
MKIKFLFITDFFYPENKVACRRIFNFANELKKLGHDITILTNNLHDRSTIFPQFNFIQLNSSDKRIFKFNFKPTNFLNTLYLGCYDYNSSLDFNINSINETYDIIFASGDPWYVFDIGVQIKKKFENSFLISDYRDAWSICDESVAITSLNNFNSFTGILKNKLSKCIEKKLLKYSDLVTGVSNPILENLSQINKNIKTKLIYNGFSEEDNLHLSYDKINKKELNLIYPGNLRSEQSHFYFVDTIDEFIDLNKDLLFDINLNIYYIGALEKNELNLYEYVQTKPNAKKVIIFTKYLSKNEVDNFIEKSDILLNFSYNNKRGISSGKLFEYLSINKPILLVSNNEDIMEEIVRKTNSGFICKTKDEIWQVIKTLIHKKCNDERIILNRNYDESNKFLYKNLGKQLIDTYISLK